MKVIKKTIFEDRFDMQKQMKRLGYTYRSLGKKLKKDPTFLCRIANGFPVSQKLALEIKNTMIAPKQ